MPSEEEMRGSLFSSRAVRGARPLLSPYGTDAQRKRCGQKKAMRQRPLIYFRSSSAHTNTGPL